MKQSIKSATALDERIGQRMRQRRTEIGMSQERLGALLGVTFQQVQKYEKGCNRISASRLVEVAGALEVPITFFFDQDPRESQQAYMSLPPDIRHAVRVLETIPTALRSRFIDLMTALPFPKLDELRQQPQAVPPIGSCSAEISGRTAPPRTA